MKIVINSDDLGISAEVNASIFRLMDKGLVRSATLMMNGPAAEEALRESRHFPQCSFGVHLNLTQFASLSAHPALAPLLDAKGEFKGRDTGHPYWIPLSKNIRKGILAEWSAQIDRALALGLRISHIDSHHHTHTRWELIETLEALCRRYKIQRVRTRVNMGCSLPSRGLAAFWNHRVRSSSGLITTDGFASFTVFHQRLIAHRPLPQTLEVMCHPGHARYNEENLRLNSDWPALLPPGSERVNYEAIAAPAGLETRSSPRI